MVSSQQPASPGGTASGTLQSTAAARHVNVDQRQLGPSSARTYQNAYASGSNASSSYTAHSSEAPTSAIGSQVAGSTKGGSLGAPATSITRHCGSPSSSQP